MGQTVVTFKEPNEYESFLVKILRRQKFMAGQELNALLVDEYKINPENARKIVQRAAINGFLTTSSPLTFGKGQYVYLANGLPFTRAIATGICKKYRPPVYRLLKALDLNNGILSYYEALKITASPEDETSSKVNTLQEILLLLSRLNFTYEYTDAYAVKYIIEKTEGKELGDMVRDIFAEKHYQKMVRDCVFIPDIIRWLQASNIIDNKNVRYRNKKWPSKGADHNGHVFDAFGYSKTTGINPILGKKADIREKQTCVLLDVIINREYDLIDVEGLLNRVQIYLRSIKTGVRKAMPIVIYKCISSHAYSLKSLGFMSFDLGSIFGSRIYEIMEKLNAIDDFQNLEKEEMENAIVSTLNIMRESGQEDNLKAIKGTLFEYLMYPLLNVIYPKAQVEQGKQLRRKINGQEEEGYEYDYIIRSALPKEIVVVELKGYASNRAVSLGSTDKRDRGSLKWFFERSFLFAKAELSKESKDGIPVKAVFITSGKFYSDGQEYLEELKESGLKSKRLGVYYDGDSLLKLLEEYDETKTQETIKKFYIDIPEVDGELKKS